MILHVLLDSTRSKFPNKLRFYSRVYYLQKKKEKETDCSNNPAETSGKKEGREVENSEVKIRELSMEDLRQAKKQVILTLFYSLLTNIAMKILK